MYEIIMNTGSSACTSQQRISAHKVLYRTNGVSIFIDYCTAPRDT